MEFPGSLTLRHETFLSVCEQYLKSAHRHGFRNFLVLNAHGGNRGIGQSCWRNLAPNTRTGKIAVCQLVAGGRRGTFPLNETGAEAWDMRASFETSLMLHIAPQSVRRDAIGPKVNVATFAGPKRICCERRAFRSIAHEANTPNGVWGDATHATAAKGRQISDIVCDALSIVVSELSG